VDDLRWILAIAGAVVVVAIFLSGRFEREEWRRDRKYGSGQPQSTNPERIEPQIDSIAEAQTVSAQKVSVGLNSEEDVNNALDESGQQSSITPSLAKECPDNSNDGWDDSVESAKQPLVEDEIVPVQIPAELSAHAEERRSKPRFNFNSNANTNANAEEPVQQELGLDVEPLVLVLTVLAKKENLLGGSKIKKVLEEEGINYGDMEIFHFRMGSETDAVFSVANLVEPGTFNTKTINDEQTPGLSLFCQLPGPVAGTVAFELLLKKARIIAENLGGQLCDDKRNLLTEQATGHYRDRISAFDHELALARKKKNDN